MIKRIFGILIPLITCAVLVGQANSKIYRVTYLKPKSGSMDQLLAGMKEHNKKYHNKGFMKVRTYRVVSGEKTGWLVRTYGPMTWAEVDKFSKDSDSKSHRADGAKLLRPYIEESTGPMYWTPMESLHYNPSTSDKPSKMTRVQFTHLNSGMSSEFYDLRQRYNETLEKTKSDASFSMGHLIHGGERHAIYATFSGMDSWSEMTPSSGPSFSSRFNQVHGNSSWGQFLKQVSKAIKKSHDEMRIYLKDQSTR
tara:strand:- start:179 stop:934 length:756 start_codon:yes stop_codon:yes gene_type:complete